MLRYSFIFFLLINLTVAEGQITFEKGYTTSFGGFASYSFEQTKDSGFIIAGNLNYDAALLRTNKYGDTLWLKTYGGPSQEEAYSVIQTFDGGFIFTGYTDSLGKGGHYDVYTVKTNSSGDTLWTKTYGGIDVDMGHCIKQTQDSGYIIAGETGSNGFGGFYLIKTNTLGDTIWTKHYGGYGIDIAYSVEQTADKGYILGGETVSYGMGLYDFYLVKTDSIGNLVWSKTYGGYQYDNGRSVHQTNDGGYVFGGYSESFGAGSWDMYIIKTNSLGDTLWTKTYGGYSQDMAYSLQQTTEGGFVITGGTWTFGGSCFIKTNSLGDTLWTRLSTGGMGGIGVEQTNDKGYATLGGLGLIKMDSLGNGGCLSISVPVITKSPTDTITTPLSLYGSTQTYVSSTHTLVKQIPVTTNGCNTIGINDFRSQKLYLNIYPNPSNGTFIVSSENGFTKQLKITITNILGEVVYNSNEESNSGKVSKEINLQNTSNGTYFVRIQTEEGVSTKKLILSK